MTWRGLVAQIRDRVKDALRAFHNLEKNCLSTKRRGTLSKITAKFIGNTKFVRKQRRSSPLKYPSGGATRVIWTSRPCEVVLRCGRFHTSHPNQWLHIPLHFSPSSFLLFANHPFHSNSIYNYFFIYFT